MKLSAGLRKLLYASILVMLFFLIIFQIENGVLALFVISLFIIVLNIIDMFVKDSDEEDREEVNVSTYTLKSKF